MQRPFTSTRRPNSRRGARNEFNSPNASRSAFLPRRGISTQSTVHPSFKGRQGAHQTFGGNKSRLSQAKCVEVLRSILSNNANIDTLLKTGELLPLINSASALTHDQLYDLLQSFIQFKNAENFPSSIKELFVLILNSSFISEPLDTLVRTYFTASPTIDNLVILISFCIVCLELLPSQSIEKMALLCPSIYFTSEQFSDKKITQLSDQFKKCIENAKKRCEQDKILSTCSTAMSRASNCDVNSYRNFSVIPQPSDIFCLDSEVKLRPNKFNSEHSAKLDDQYESVDDYLDTQFCLLKEDFVRPLREGIATLRMNMLITDKLNTRKLQIRVYEKVIIENMFTSRNGLVYRVMFDVTKLGKIDWKKARRFIYGSLLCFTNNFFDTLYFASVVDSDSKNLEKGILAVQFNNDPISEVLDNNEFLMIETKNLFEAYRHVLTKLQTFTEETLPFSRYIVFGNNKPKIPEFMSNYDIQMIVDKGRQDQDFDESQRNAFVNALQSNVSLIQGPPGTGKTFVGLKIIKHLVNNFQTVNYDIGPILVVCYTNHALDQFLKDIIATIGIENVIRVGGRSKLDIMKECNISNIRSRWMKKKAFEHGLFRRGAQNRKEIEYAEEVLVEKYAKVKNYDKKLLSFKDLSCCLNYTQIQYFQRIKFDSWIKGGDSMLNDTIDMFSNLKKDVITEQSEICIDDFVKETLTDLLNDVGLWEEYDMDDMVEDPDDVLHDRNFLDDDFNIMKDRNKYQKFYDEAEKVDYDDGTDEDGFKCVANVKLLINRLKKTKPLTEEEYNALTTLDVDYSIRLRIYKYWLEKYRIILIEHYNNAKAEFDTVNKEREEVSFEEYIAIMRSVKVIGMTTTGAARYSSVLDRVGCRVVVIEEAAEVLESHVVCALSKHCDQLIMIGDHKQLRPKVEVYELEKNFNFGISLFERLIANECQFTTLQYQHRMRPEISVCVKPIYPDLRDSDNVFKYDSIPGMNTDIYFFDHSNPENDSIETSYKNDFEAKFIAKLCEYLIKCGNLPQHITVLTLYSGQLYNISKHMQNQMFRGIRICVLDNFQGEENEIIILSLVRSNDNDVVGFVNNDNRLCVTLSRAKRGFYVVGNFTMLCRKINLLRDIVDKHLDPKSIGSALPLQCLMHPAQNKYFITNLQDFEKKGCPSVCDMVLQCGHRCVWPCHREKPSHANYFCKMPCEKLCVRQLHGCTLVCGQRCVCNEKITIRLKCDHKKEVICHQTAIKCMEICQKKLGCKHVCKKYCHEQCKCEVMLDYVLKCGHHLEAVCGTDISTVECDKICGKELACGHKCKCICSKPCVCSALVGYLLPCSHIAKLRCGSNLEEVQCNVSMERQFQCGHRNKYECYENIDSCTTVVERQLKCGHTCMEECGKSLETLICPRVCDSEKSCHHKCNGKCGECYQGRLHVACRGRCRRRLRCGHYCDKLCHPGLCPPCHKPCATYCKHSTCKSACGSLCKCTMCQLDCDKKIKCAVCHKTEPCSKRCGENCLKLCKSCVKIQRINEATHYIMEPCNCSVLKAEFHPTLKVIDNEVSLQCQNCQRSIRHPYRGVFLLHLKKEYLILFQPMSKVQLEKFEDLFENFNVIHYQPKKIVTMMQTINISKEDLKRFEIAYEKYHEVMQLCNTIANINGETRLDAYLKEIKKHLIYFIEWLNPFFRNFDDAEMRLIELEKCKLSLSIDILVYLHSVNVTDYALIHKQLFEILDGMGKIGNQNEISELCEQVAEIKRNLNNTKTSTKEEEDLVERIIAAKDIYKEFHMDTFSVEDKLKEIKKLIRRCHPDKNKSCRANDAVKLLLEKKKLLE